MSDKFFVRDLDPGMGLAVAKRTYLRENETWKELAERVALGNTLLHESGREDYSLVRDSVASGKNLTAGRHLQHGDSDQPGRNLEIFSNCSTSCSSFLKFYLLMNGSGVGRNYSDEFMLVDWHNMPNIYMVLDKSHPDYNDKVIGKQDTNLYPVDEHDLYHVVGDNREGWAKVLEIIETAAFSKTKVYDNYVFDCSLIRPYGTPIKGMQNRPASGPIPFMEAMNKIAVVKHVNVSPWKQTMFIDHFASECVANGGARRSARIAVKYWKDAEILDFIKIKKDFPWMWTSNNSVGTDDEFWDNCRIDETFANTVFEAIVKHSFQDGTGEPGVINLDKLTVK